MPAADKHGEWLPITPQDWQIKDAPGYPGAGAIAWSNSSATALKLGRKDSIFVTTPEPESSVMKRTARATLTADGSLKGEINIELNGQAALDARPPQRKSSLDYAGYEVSSSLQGGQLTTRRSLRVDKADFPTEMYPELKGFFSVVAAGDTVQAVLSSAQRQAAH